MSLLRILLLLASLIILTLAKGKTYEHVESLKKAAATGKAPETTQQQPVYSTQTVVNSKKAATAPPTPTVAPVTTTSKGKVPNIDDPTTVVHNTAYHGHQTSLNTEAQEYVKEQAKK